MANKYFDKIYHISRDSHVRLCPASHENPEQSIVLFKVRTTVIPSTCLFVYGLVFHQLEKPTLIRTKLDNYVWHPLAPSSSLFPHCHARHTTVSSVVTYRSRRQKREINTAELISPGYWKRGSSENFKMALASPFRNCELADRKN